MKKIIALVLALVMILSLSTVAFAEKKGYLWSGEEVVRYVNGKVAEVAAGILFGPVVALQDMIEGSGAALAGIADDVMLGADEVATTVQDAVEQADWTTFVLVKNVKHVYQAGIYAVRGVALLTVPGFRDSEANKTLQEYSENAEMIDRFITAVRNTVKETVGEYADVIDYWAGFAGFGSQNKTWLGSKIMDKADDISAWFDDYNEKNELHNEIYDALNDLFDVLPG